jgi:hypothetical protein
LDFQFLIFNFRKQFFASGLAMDLRLLPHRFLVREIAQDFKTFSTPPCRPWCSSWVPES